MVARVDTLKLKDFIYRKIGQTRADSYFDQLKKFLSFKVNKVDFDRSCIETIGRENLPLHNQLIQSILQNACHAKVSPQKPRKVGGLGVKVSSGNQKPCTKSLYGDMLLQSPRKCRSPIHRDRKFRDRPSPLGPLGKSPSLTVEETVMTQEQPNGKDFHSLNSRPLVDDGEEEVNQVAGSTRFRRWCDITAPLGVFQNKGASLNVPLALKRRNFAESCQSSCELPDTRSLTSCLREKLASEGVGISLDCANLINNSLDVFLKRLIEPCLRVARLHSDGRMVPSTDGLQRRFASRPLFPTSASMLDFRVAMESNPLILGDDWPAQLEKICTYALEK